MPKTILLIRHAIAQNRRDAAKADIADADRKLTAIGKKRFHDSALGLSKLQHDIDTIFTSPYRRARETARILKKYYPKARLTTLRWLKPEIDTQIALQYFSSVKAKVIALVGHEPDLGLLVSHFLTGRSSRLIALKKGSVCCLCIKKRGKSHTARLQWLLTSSQLTIMACHERHV
jgi:phosphohistidine phosphatase